MLKLQLLFFAPIAATALTLALAGNSLVAKRAALRFSALGLVACLLAAAALSTVAEATAPGDGLKHASTWLGACTLAILPIGLTQYFATKNWSAASRVILAIIASAIAAFLSPAFMLVAACAMQANCL